uniref:Uncharacterized protein n=1 Tax=viral metagenome TaxID=1070528 RepID=A0A6C0DU53_9ZZZZ
MLTQKVSKFVSMKILLKNYAVARLYYFTFSYHYADIPFFQKMANLRHPPKFHFGHFKNVHF